MPLQDSRSGSDPPCGEGAGLTLTEDSTGDNRRRFGVERIRSHRQREEVRVAPLEVLHVVQPFRHQETVRPPDVAREVSDVAFGEILQTPSVRLFLGEVEYGPEKVRERIVLEEVGILQQSKEKIPSG